MIQIDLQTKKSSQQNQTLNEQLTEKKNQINQRDNSNLDLLKENLLYSTRVNDLEDQILELKSNVDEMELNVRYLRKKVFIIF